MSGIELILLGFAVGTFGTLVGIGGGFILVPVLLLLYPDKSPEVITGISLAVITINSASASVAYGFKKKLDYRSALFFAITTIPGSIIGTHLTQYMPRDSFSLVFGLLMIALAVYLFLNPKKKHIDIQKQRISRMIWPSSRSLTDVYGNTAVFTFDLFWGMVLSFFVGIFSSLMGIGGGVIQVPAMIHLFNFPVHFATATSQLLLGIMGLTSSIVHLVKGNLDQDHFLIIFLGLGVIAGAQFGAAISNRIKGSVIIRTLAIALAVVAIRVLWMSFAG